MGCDPFTFESSVSFGNFNPRTRMGCDIICDLDIDFQSISIHAPVWGATTAILAPIRYMDYFNPRTRMGCDESNMKQLSEARVFQSTHPYGVRLFSCHNSREMYFISIHAPVWGATSLDKRPSIGCLISIHAPVWGATIMICATSDDLPISIHAPVWGATKEPKLVQVGSLISIHAPVWGATP